MIQAISVYISKAIFGPDTLELVLLNLEQQRYVTIWNKTTTTQILGVSHLFYNTAENLWCICDLRSEPSHIYYIPLH